MERADLERLDRDTLIMQAETAGVVRAAVLTRPELIDELLVRGAKRRDDPALGRARGLFGRARDLLTRVIERGLHLPDAGERVRPARPSTPPPPRMPSAAVPTVTLAEIYATQGHKEKALETLRRVIEIEPDHDAARTLAAEIEGAELPKPALPPETDDVDGDSADDGDDDAADDVEGTDVDGETGADSGRDASHDVGVGVEGTRGNGLAARGGAGSGVDDSDGRDGLKPKTKRKKAKGKLKVAVVPASPNAAAKKALDPEEIEAAVEPPEPMGMLDDQPLPPKYNVDECVVIPVDPTTMFVYWEMKDETRAHLERTRPGGAIFLRVLVIEPSWDGPRTFTRDHEVYVGLGDWFIRELPPGCVVRAAIGWRTNDGAFVPVAHSPALEAHPSRPSALIADALVRWTPQGAVPIQRGDVDAVAIERALGRAEVAATTSRRASAGGIPTLDADRSPSVDPLGASERLARAGRRGGSSEISLR